MPRESREYGGEFSPSRMDLVLAVFTAFGMPILFSMLYRYTGALIPLIVYYGVFCFGLVQWRKQTLDYSTPQSWFSPLFLVFLLLQFLQIPVAWIGYDPLIEVHELGWILTLLCWAPMNAVSEQLSWIYVFDTFANYYQQGRKKLIYTGIGFTLYIVLIGLIHALFWNQFLFSPEYTYPWNLVFFANSFLTSIAYLLLYKKTKSMIHPAIIHLFTDVRAVLFTGYSLLPYLLF